MDLKLVNEEERSQIKFHIIRCVSAENGGLVFPRKWGRDGWGELKII